MVSITYRNTDGAKWGTGKGSNLTPIEVDENFWSIEEFLDGIASEIGGPNQIASITVDGSEMTFHMDNGDTFGPFTLPEAAFNFTGAFAAGAYAVYDFFTASDGLYMVLQAHTATLPFVSSAGNISGPYYRLIMPFPNLYDLGFFFPGDPGRGIDNGEAVFTFRATQSFYLPAGLTDSVGGLEVACTSTMTFPIYKNTTSIGTMSIADSTGVATFSFASDVQFDANDRLRVLRSFVSLDATARDLTLTLKATKGTL